MAYSPFARHDVSPRRVSYPPPVRFPVVRSTSNCCTNSDIWYLAGFRPSRLAGPSSTLFPVSADGGVVGLDPRIFFPAQPSVLAAVNFPLPLPPRPANPLRKWQNLRPPDRLTVTRAPGSTWIRFFDSPVFLLFRAGLRSR